MYFIISILFTLTTGFFSNLQASSSQDEGLMASRYDTFIHPKAYQKTLNYEKKCTYAGLINRYLALLNV